MILTDPLFVDGVDGVDVAIIIGKAVFVFVLLLLTVLLLIWIERKVVADMQNRIGPNRAGPWGILQSLADGVKLFFKEQSIPDSADKPIFRLAPYLSLLPAFLAFSVIPFGGTITIAGRETYLQLVEIPIGVLFVLAMSGIGVYGITLAGWSSGSKYPLLGGVRATAQMISYEAAIGLAILGAVLQGGTLSTRGMVLEQGPWDGIGTLGEWFFIATPVSFVIFVIAMIAETNRAPFDLVEAEQEIVGGFHTEYTGVRFAIFFLAEYMNMVTMSAIAVTLFLGGPAGPEIDVLPAIWPPIWFLLKVSIFIFLYIWLRATLPRLRYDQLMNLGWRYLIPGALGWLVIVAVFTQARNEGWPIWAYVGVVAVALLGAVFLRLAWPDREPVVKGVQEEPEEVR
ncbi:MAG TPA: NADH-quinone oxidoreductase subunit NuoH [Acidimicrobiia bacterium]|nr:NADH-quinone oxidoreductase subunit NuoH [Acidimicrobiia bacterium]